MSSFAFDRAVEDVLHRIHDPCSVAAGRPTSVLDMGLVRSWRLGEDGVLDVVFAVTFPGCTMAPHFMGAAEEELARIDGVRAVRTRVDTDFAWTPELMRRTSPPMAGTPQAWRTRQEKNASQAS